MNSIDKIKKSMLHYHQFELTSNRNKNMSDNEMIAQFMGANTPIESEDVQSYEMYGVLECIEDGVSEKHFFLPEEMRFHTSWDWLMLVVQECKCVKEADYVLIDAIDFSLCNNDLLGVHEAVVKFIKAQKL